MRSIRLRILSFAIGLLLIATGAQAQLLNPGFEQGVDPGGSLRLYQGSQDIIGWTVTGDVLQYGGTDWAAEQGARSVGLYDPLFPGIKSAIWQRFGTTPGAEYVVLFWYAPAPLSGPTLNRYLTVRAAGGEVVFHTIGIGSTSAPGWRQGSVAFTATADSASLEFANVYDGQKGGLLVDNVLVTAPVPVRASTWGQIKTRYR
ncbi:MAG: DUF642 domain-containing protein [Candidatus Eisenbacteria bacterium]